MEGLGQQFMKRYNRQIILPEIGITGQQKLGKASILVIGAGGLGCPLLMYLAGAGAGHIGLVDHDVVDESNLHRQVLYHQADIGKYKVDVAAARLALFNPDVRFSSYPIRLTSQNAAELLARYDLIIDGSDNFPTRYLVNDACVTLNKPLVFGSIFHFEGQVSVFNYRGGPDYRSIYPEPPLPEEVPNCAESGVVGPLPGIIGSLMANEAIKIICDFGEVLSGQLLIFNALNNTSRLFKFGHSTKKKIRKTEKVEELSIHTLEQWKTEGIHYQLVDVREADEYEEHNIGGINIPLYRLNSHLPELSRHQKIVFCCSVGKRSRIAIQLLKTQSEAELFSLIVPAKSNIS